MKNRLKHVKQEEFNILRVNGARVQQHELSLTRKRENYVPYSVTRKSKVALEITDRGLLQRLQELENKKLERQSKVFLIAALDISQEEHLIALRHVFDLLGYKVILLKDISEIPISSKQCARLWCLSESVGRNASSHCLQKNNFYLCNNQKISPIPGLEKLLLRNDGFCYLTSASMHIPALQDKFNYLSPPCFVLPAQTELFLRHTEEKRSHSFTLKTLGSDATPVNKWGATDSNKIEGPLEAVLQLFPADVALIEEKAVIVQVYVLVTSVSPLRVYRHSEGHALLVHNGLQDASDKQDNGKFFQHLETYFGEDRVSEAIQQMDELVVKMLLLLEPSLLIYFTSMMAGKQTFRCKQCFQPLQISFAFSSGLDPFILEVKAATLEKVSQGIIHDTVNLFFNTSSVPFSHDMHQTLKALKQTLAVKNGQCEGVKGTKCLTDDLLEYLLETKQEALHSGNFKRLYPTPDGLKYKALISDLLDTGVELHDNQKDSLSTSDVHDILTAFVAHTSTHAWERKAVSKSTIETSNPRLLAGSTKETLCNNDPDADAVLAELNSRPALVLQPEFNSNVFSYQTTLSFDTMVLQIWGKTSACHSDVRVNTKYKDSQTSNHSLGVGWNKFSIFVVDTSRSTPDIVNTYSLSVFRERRSEMESTFDLDSTHQVCAHHQECSLKVFPSMPCGLQMLLETTWKTFLWKQKELPACETGHEQGRWVLPCASCDNSDSCYWREAVWAPHKCRYNVMSRDDARTCLANKKILFVGDSTNRGIMYYLMEKLNGSLRKWEKTHTMKIYSDELNGRGTSVSFAYYPQFWLPENKRPVFVKALYQLIARFLPLENNTNTILVVGGVQWMGAHHITETNKALTSLGLNGIKVIIKSLGSGFHLPVPGLPRHDLAGQRRTAERNQQVIAAARRHGYQVVDTFGMTVSRYKDFLMGNCGCHFHKVIDMRSLMKEEDEVPSPLLENQDKNTDHLPRYHVTGPINSVYSELVINRMCS